MDATDLLSSLPGISRSLDLEDIDADTLFSKVLDHLRNDLSYGQKALFKKFDSAKDMLVDLRAYPKVSSTDRLYNSCHKIASFNAALGPYFHVLDVFVQVKPDYLAWFWGAISLICKLGSNYVGFFEKATDTLDTIATCLPQYRNHLETCVKRKGIDHSRLVKSLALVYAEIIDFCRQLCVMLSGPTAKDRKWRQRIAFVGDIMWKPFESRFGDLLARLEQHKHLFEAEMAVSDRTVLTRIDSEQERLNLLYQQLQSLMDHGFSRLEEESKKQHMLKAKQNMDMQLSRLKAWLPAREYRNIYERARSSKEEGSGRWLLSWESYEKWKDAPWNWFDLNGDSNPDLTSVLFVHAKPGFGKTYLSTTIIDDLESSRPTTSDNCKVSTAFYHFSANTSAEHDRRAVTALRSISNQLLAASDATEDQNALDSLSVIMRGDQASFNDTVDALLLISRVALGFVVIDAVDECVEYEELLKGIGALSSTRRFRFLLLSRPDLPLPYEFRSPNLPVIMLQTKDNYSEMTRWLGRNFKELVEQGLFGAGALPSNVVEQICRRANGIFLWARIFINYLKSPAMALYARHGFISDMSSFDGLDGLCTAILERLDRRIQPEREVAGRIFQWVGASIKTNALSVDALRTALGITPGRPTSELDLLVEFSRSLPILTGALVETDVFGRPTFIHLSVQQFLESQRCMRFPNFSLRNSEAINCRIAQCCLSYLVYDLPPHPLIPLDYGKPPLKPTRPESQILGHYGSSQQIQRAIRLLQERRESSDFSEPAVDAAKNLFSSPEFNDRKPLRELAADAVEKRRALTALNAEYPFLQYATISWAQHLWRAIDPRHRDESPSILDHKSTMPPFLPHWVPVLSQFLLHREVVTNWVYSTLLHEKSPSVAHLVAPVQSISAQFRQWGSDNGLELGPDTREVHWVFHGIRQLDQALEELGSRHGASLARNPSLIWQSHVRSATDSHFWPVWRGGLNPVTDQDPPVGEMRTFVNAFTSAAQPR